VRHNLRRFALVACTVTGALTWLTIPAKLDFPRPTFAIAGLVAAIISAIVPRSPPIFATAFARIALAGCIVFALIGFGGPVGRDLRNAGIDLAFLGGWIILLWLIAIGVLARLLIPGLTPSQAYAGTLLGLGSVAAFLEPSLADIVTIGSCLVLAAIPTFLAAWVTDHLLRLAATDEPAMPAARVVRLDSSPEGGLGEGTSLGD